MSNYSDIVEDSRVVDLRRIDNKRKRLFIPFNFYGQGIKSGIISGIGMALFLFALSISGGEELMGIKFLKYLILGGVLTYALNSQKKYLADRYQYKKGMLFGLFITAVSAIVLAVSDFLFFSIFDSVTLEKFSIEADSLGSLMVITGVIFFETLVYGMILTFIILQYLKTKKRPV